MTTEHGVSARQTSAVIVPVFDNYIERVLFLRAQCIKIFLLNCLDGFMSYLGRSGLRSSSI